MWVCLKKSQEEPCFECVLTFMYTSVDEFHGDEFLKNQTTLCTLRDSALVLQDDMNGKNFMCCPWQIGVSLVCEHFHQICAMT